MTGWYIAFAAAFAFGTWGTVTNFRRARRAEQAEQGLREVNKALTESKAKLAEAEQLVRKDEQQ